MSSSNSDQPLFYVSPGLQLMYDFHNISFGIKLSLGAALNANICNITAGLLGGKRKEYYLEFQDIPYVYQNNYSTPIFTGFGIGMSKIKIGNNINSIQPRFSIFAGYLLFMNITCTLLKQNINILKTQIGSTLVCPIPLNLDLNDGNWN